MTTKKPSILNPEIMEEIFHQIKIPAGDYREPKKYPLITFMLSGREPFEIALRFYDQMKEAEIQARYIIFKSFKGEEYKFYRSFPLFKLFCQTLFSSVEKITCFKDYPIDLPLFKNVKYLREFNADAFYVLTYPKFFAHIELIEKAELQISFNDVEQIHNLPFPCHELHLKNKSNARFIKHKTLISVITDEFAAKTSANLDSVKKLTVDELIDERNVGNLEYHKIASCFASKFKNLQNFAINFSIFMEGDLQFTNQFDQNFVNALNNQIPNIQLKITFTRFLQALRSHVDFYDSIVASQNYEINLEEKTAKRIFQCDKCTIEIFLSFG